MSVSAEKELDRARDFLSGVSGAAERAISNALNNAAKQARESAIASICDRYAVRSSDVRETISLKMATPEKPSVSVVAKSGPLSMSYFPHSPDLSGTGGRGRAVLVAEILRGQKKEVGGAFVAPINGKNRIMARVGRDRLPIKSMAALPLAAMLGVESVRTTVEERALAVLNENIDREIDRALKRAA